MRVVSLCPSLTELVFDLDRGSDLVGITDYCVHPAEGVAAIEKIGGTKTPDISRIVELAPDLVLLNDEENRIEDARALHTAGITCLSSLPRDPKETAAMVRSIGEALGSCALAGEIADQIERRSDRVARQATGRPPVRFVYLIWRRPWMTVSGDTFAHSLLALAGGDNVFADHPERYPQLAPVDLQRAAPCFLFLGSEPFPFADAHVEELARMTGMDHRHILLVDGEYLSWHGSRTPHGIDYAAALIEGARTSLPPRRPDC